MNLEEMKEDLGQVISLEMVLIPAGKFVMGSPESEEGRSDDETQHEVTLTKPYYMGKYEVTQEQWEALMGNNRSFTKGAKLPVTDVSWNDCQDFIKKLNEKTNGNYRLPTEAEWEYACRAGTTTAFSVGDSLTDIDANIDVNSRKAVGSYKPNAFELYDMHGNAWEWCEDWYDWYTEGAVTDPKGPATGNHRVLRGGICDSHGNLGRSASRFREDPDGWNIPLGFRLVRTVDIKTFEDAVIATIEKELMLIPAGKFVMGSPESEEGRSDDEMQHEVTLTKPYYMGKYEVTEEQWEAVMGDNRSSINGAKLPVRVWWDCCQEFIEKLNAKTSGGYRLPTEAEWEYACRAGTTTAFSVGDSLTDIDANIDVNSRKAVGSYKPNAFGLYDMHGNVWEWCEDWYARYPEGPATDPKGPATGECRVLRGGIFHIRSASRFLYDPDGFIIPLGFRLARTK